MRVGICQPLDVEGFDIYMDYPAVIRRNITWYTNLEDLDADTTGNAFFHDTDNGYACSWFFFSFLLSLCFLVLLCCCYYS